MPAKTGGPEQETVSALTVFSVFLGLGLTSFGGPVAHLGYFRRELVERRRWLTEAAYAELVALCQFLPGPASSQTGFAIGLRMAGVPGALAAFIGFTLPSALLMLAAAYSLALASHTWFGPIVHGLKLVAVSVVAHAVVTMARTHCRSLARATLAILALIILLLSPHPLATPAIILIAGLTGLIIAPRTTAPAPAAPSSSGLRTPLIVIGIFAALLIGLPLLRQFAPTPLIAAADSFYRAGALVFGGGHVVLPLLQSETAQTISPETFLAGYGAAQALPGPLFSFAAYLGALLNGASPNLIIAAIALVMIFLPGFLLVAAALPLWSRFSRHSRATGFVLAVNAAVVGVLAAALWRPVITSAISAPIDAAIAAAGFLALLHPRTPVIAVVAAVTLAGAITTGIG